MNPPILKLLTLRTDKSILLLVKTKLLYWINPSIILAPVVQDWDVRLDPLFDQSIDKLSTRISFIRSQSLRLCLKHPWDPP